jgi:hypothetical protein
VAWGPSMDASFGTATILSWSPLLAAIFPPTAWVAQLRSLLHNASVYYYSLINTPQRRGKMGFSLMRAAIR